MMEALHPDRVGQFAAEELEEGGQPMEVDEDDDEFAVSSRPKQLAADVVRGKRILEKNWDCHSHYSFPPLYGLNLNLWPHHILHNLASNKDLA